MHRPRERRGIRRRSRRHRHSLEVFLDCTARQIEWCRKAGSGSALLCGRCRVLLAEPGRCRILHCRPRRSPASSLFRFECLKTRYEKRAASTSLAALFDVRIGGGGGSRTRVRKQWQPGYYMLVSPFDLVRVLSGEREPDTNQPLDLMNARVGVARVTSSHHDARFRCSEHAAEERSRVFRPRGRNRCSRLWFSIGFTSEPKLGMQP